MKENILILADMEGIIGIYDMSDKDKCKSYMETEIKLLLDELISNDEFEIYFCDIHDNGETTSELYSLYPTVNFIKCYWNIDFKIKYDYAMLTGLHAKSGIGVLAHSFRDEIKNVFLGERIVGEIEVFINLLAYYKIPTIFVSADEQAMNEIPSYVVSTNISKSSLDKEKVKNNLTKKYKAYVKNLRYGLSHRDRAKYKYNSDSVQIELQDNNLLQYLEDSGIYTKSNMIYINDNVKIMDNLLKVANLMNTYYKNEYVKLLKKLREKFRNCDFNNIKSKKMKRILSIPLQNLSLDDLKIVNAELEKIFY
ncbi:M55 family metallopeptidase [Sedimentibacter sp. zth1]|uniref:M55 family metallopeptidase n=1 Tax=Sedimentibacter sp. zth1 TaxID=2816908 RepID=UPI001A919900|nr:M55 family metallopeptidase [Sedimentibacter sp. zth1]QSX05562.1 M55 family metallopeptidase [Sedimentibacter sp. zth1]